MTPVWSLFVLFAVWDEVTAADCGVVSKKEWDGLTPTHVTYLARPLDLVIIEHTVTPTCSTDTTCEELVRSIQNNQIDNLGFWDIGYNFIVGGNGKVYEGAGWLHRGAHTFGYNGKSIGIAFLGNFNNDQPTSAAMNAVKDLIKCGVEKGHLKADYNLIGHKQVIATESPGRKLYNEIRRWPNYLENAASIRN